jgi:hypothetical protein
MSLICYYIRTELGALEVLSKNPDLIFEDDWPDLPPGSEVIDIDKAYDAIAWLASPVARADAAHSARLIADPDWPDAKANVDRLNEMAIDDAFAAVKGVTDERVDGFDFGLGAARVFRPERVQSLAAVVCALDEDVLRRAADFSVMDKHDVQPSGWLEEGEGEAILSTYVFPHLRRLKAFYAKARRLNQAVLVVWT